MHVSHIRYEKLKNLGDYNNERVCVEVTLNEGESEVEAIDRAKKFVAKQLRSKDVPFSVTRAREVLEDVDNHSPNAVKNAQEVIAKWEEENGTDSLEF